MNENNKSTSTSLAQDIVQEKYNDSPIASKVKDFRRDIDSFYLTCKAIATTNASRELALAITEFQQGRQFCGLILREKGSVSPYNNEKPVPNSQRTETGEIIPLDTCQNLIEKMQLLREKCADLITEFRVFNDNNAATSLSEVCYCQQVFVNITAGKLWLGEVIGVEMSKRPADA